MTFRYFVSVRHFVDVFGRSSSVLQFGTENAVLVILPLLCIAFVVGVTPPLTLCMFGNS